MLTKPLSAAQMEALNSEFGLDLAYDNATHYRAAQVIHSLRQELRLPAPAAAPGGDSPAAVPAPADTASSCPATSADTDG